MPRGNYSKLKTTYDTNREPPLGATPSGWWAIIGSNKDQIEIKQM